MSKNPKTNLPAFSQSHLLLDRPRIHELLAKALESHLSLVIAGEGYGKTYAVSSFLRQRSETTIWIQFSERDNHPWRFWENYTNAMGLCKGRAGRELREIGFPETARQFSKWFEIVRKEFSVPGRYIIVGDDFHTIKSPMVRELIERSFHYPIRNQSLILICRSEPSSNLVPFLSKGQFTRIGAEDLLFTQEEIADYLRLENITLSSEETAAIHRETEGWPLVMGLLAGEIHKNQGKYTTYMLEKGAFRSFEDVLFKSLPEELRGFLVKLSLFVQWPLDLLEKTSAVLPEQYRIMPLLLAELEKISSLIRYDYYLRGFHIHRVFLDYLREKQKDIKPEEIKKISAIAAAWCLENNLKMDAAINFERAGDYRAIAGIVDTFPRVVPLSAAAPLLDIIERMVQREESGEGDEHFIYLRYVVRGRLLMCLSRLDEAADLFRESIRHFENKPPSPVTSRVLAESWDYMGFIILMKDRFGSTEEYAPCFENAARYYRRHPWPLSKSITFCNVSSYIAQLGHPAAAGEFERRVKIFTGDAPRTGYSLNGYISSLGDVVRAEFAYFQGDLNTAEQYARRTVIRAREQKQYEIENRGLFFLMRLSIHRGSPDELLEAWKQKNMLLDLADYSNRETINDVYDGWIYTHLGTPNKTPLWLRNRLEVSDLYSMFRNYESLVKAKYLYAEKQYAEATAFLNLKEHQNGLGSFLLGMLEMNCLEAAARFRLGEETAALALLEKTYEAAIPNVLNMPFIELGYDMRSLAGLALESGSVIPRSWLEDIRSRASAYGKNLYAVAEYLRAREAPGAAVYLTRLERAVLQGLSRGQTRETIAAAAGQPLSAVKSAISRTCEKLGAVNRADAVRIASTLGILGKNE